jgi:hypothetical protein
MQQCSQIKVSSSTNKGHHEKIICCFRSGGFRFGLGFLFAQKPGSLGIAGNYLP